MMMSVKHLFCILCCCLTLAACSVIDDDLSVCDNSYELDYELRLVTNMTTELKAQLTTETQLSLAHSLRTHLSEVFTDFAHDVDLSFYDTQGDSLRLQHDEHIMDANQASYALNLPKRQYMHLAVANIVDNPLVDLVDDNRCHTARLTRLQSGTVLRGEEGAIVDSHTTGIFTARQLMKVLEGLDQQFNVRLYMANCAGVLVIDTIDSDVKDIKVYSTGFAVGFNVADSSYIFTDNPPLVRANRVEAHDPGEVAFCSVTFPSREVPVKKNEQVLRRVIIETDEPFIAPSADESLWEFHIYATGNDGTETQNILYVRRPLRAGQLMILKVRMHADGSVTSGDPTVGVSVTLNWNDGGNHNVPL